MLPIIHGTLIIEQVMCQQLIGDLLKAHVKLSQFFICRVFLSGQNPCKVLQFMLYQN